MATIDHRDRRRFGGKVRIVSLWTGDTTIDDLPHFVTVPRLLLRLTKRQTERGGFILWVRLTGQASSVGPYTVHVLLFNYSLTFLRGNTVYRDLSYGWNFLMIEVTFTSTHRLLFPWIFPRSVRWPHLNSRPDPQFSDRKLSEMTKQRHPGTRSRTEEDSKSQERLTVCYIPPWFQTLEVPQGKDSPGSCLFSSSLCGSRIRTRVMIVQVPGRVKDCRYRCMVKIQLISSVKEVEWNILQLMKGVEGCLHFEPKFFCKTFCPCKTVLVRL